MAAPETTGGKRIGRRWLLGGIGAGAVAAPFAGAGVGLLEQGMRDQNPFTTQGSEIGFLFLQRPSGEALGKQYSVRGVIRTQAKAVADRIAPPALDRSTIQGTDWDPRQPEINRMAVAEAALVLAEIQFGIKGREVVAQTIQQGGLAVTYEGVKVQKITPGHEQQKPYTITLPRKLMGAHIPYEGLERVDRVDDFKLLDDINGFVQKTIQDTAARNVAPNSFAALAGNAGDILGAGALVGVSTAALEPNPVTTRRRWLRWSAAGVASLGMYFVAGHTNAGGKLVALYDQAQLSGSALGTDYAHPNATFADFFGSEFFTTDIKNKLIVPTKFK